MSLVTNLEDLATRAGTEDKALRTLINGNAVDLSALSTTAKSNLVAAVNEVVAAVAGASGIDDNTTSTTTSWSSSKTTSEISTASTADRARANHTGTQSADTVVDGTTNHVFTAADDTKLGGIATGATANATDAQLRDRSTHTGTQASSTIANFAADVDARIDLRVAGAPAALDTLDELAAAIGDDANFATTVTTALGNRVRADAAQAFTAPQQAQARTNIAAAASADVGDVAASDPVAAFEAALV
jgi:hypothetical protein